MNTICPICAKPIPETLLERHVNSCLDGQEKPSTTDTKISKKRDAFTALGLKLDSQKKKNKSEIKKSESFKEQSFDESIQAIKSQPDQEDEKHTPTQNDAAKELAELKRKSGIPLAHRLRPKTLSEFIGQEHVLGEGATLSNIIKSDLIPSFILWGPPGSGKTTLCRVIAKESSHKFVELSAADSTAKNLKDVFSQAENHRKLTGQRTILFVDEIHRYNKLVQDKLLPHVEKGTCTVIGATTENPSFSLNNALLSRMHVFVLEPFSTESVMKILNRALFEVNKMRKLLFKLPYLSIDKAGFKYIADLCMGDSRVALNILETVNAYSSANKEEEQKNEPTKITVDDLKTILKSRNFHQMYDKNGDAHYDIISAFHKSIRGSDVDAAMFYLVKMLSGGEDPLFILRRMTVIASEDIGLRDGSCLPFMVAAKQAFEFVGMPEGEIILAHCTTKLARAPKSTRSYRALRSAQRYINENPDVLRLPVPIHLKNAPTRLMKSMGFGEDYKYNPNYENGIVKQKYFPNDMEPIKFFEDTHLGSVRDPSVPSEIYEKEKTVVDQYNDYLQWSKERKKNKKAEEKEEEEYVSTKMKINDTSKTESSDGIEENDENSEEDERSEYSDDPDCTNNFGKSYDEFLDRDSQPEYNDDTNEDMI
ncbi:MGS1 [Candida pseudojiufengensis]|uniref:MGS1 n=1 Tax=Candida pseudojiufengensis TaxID=497109 RepID=UPI002224CA0E|nr:MGS1 [Candida pseudojiufengensis]KAI5966280.1 MGS1 [Candida pseudojiufengensis]